MTAKIKIHQYAIFIERKNLIPQIWSAFFTVDCILQNSSTYWEGKADAESLQRLYGISFPDPKMMKEWKHLQEEAAKRNHRKIGQVRLISTSSELQIRGGVADNSKIIFHISQWKHMLWPLIRTAWQDGSNEGSQHMFYFYGQILLLVR